MHTLADAIANLAHHIGVTNPDTITARGARLTEAPKREAAYNGNRTPEQRARKNARARDRRAEQAAAKRREDRA